MTRVVESPDDFTIIGENIHATRIVLRNGRRMTTLEDGTEAVPFTGESGESLHLRVPESFKSTQPYQQGQIKHLMIAVMKGPRKNSRAGTVRLPLARDCNVNVASRASMTAGMSAAGSACARLPPMVPTLRTWRSPICSHTSAMIGNRSLRRAAPISSW